MQSNPSEPFKNKTLANREESIYVTLWFAIAHNLMRMAALAPGLVGIRTGTCAYKIWRPEGGSRHENKPYWTILTENSMP